MNVNELERNIIIAYSQNDYDFINNTLNDLTAKLFKLDKWFNKYLDIFSEKMDIADDKDPIKVLYKAKFEEYSKISKVLKVAKHYSELSHV